LDEIERHTRYPHQLLIDADGSKVALQYRRSRKLRAEPDECYMRRELFCWVVQNGDRVGSLHFVEWHIDWWADHDGFVEHMDRHCQAAADFADVVCSAWDINDLIGLGPIIEFRLSWMANRASNGRIWPLAAVALIDLCYVSKSAVLVLKAFPLEYQGVAPPRSLSAKWMNRRRAAMLRHYRRHLGVQLLPAKLGKDGWM